MWDVYRLSPDTIWVNSQEALNLSKKILQGSANSAFKFNFDVSQGMLGGGIMIREYLNRFSMQGGSTLAIKVHPNLPAGTILFTTAALPSNVKLDPEGKVSLTKPSAEADDVPSAEPEDLRDDRWRTRDHQRGR